MIYSVYQTHACVFYREGNETAVLQEQEDTEEERQGKETKEENRLVTAMCERSTNRTAAL
jgi:hypothetical protein